MASRTALAGIALFLAMSGCGGNNDDDTPSPTPTPTGTPSTSPSGTPSPTAMAFPLTAVREFSTLSGALTYTGDIAGPIMLNAAALDAFGDRARLALQPTTPPTGPNETVVRELTEETRFVAADLQTAAAPTVTAYSYAKPAAATGASSQLLLLNNSVAGQVTSDPALALTYVSYLTWLRSDGTAAAKRSTLAVFGNASTTAEVPTTGSVSYTMRLAGRYVIARPNAAGTVGDLGGTVTTSINYGTGVVTISAQLTRGGVAYANLTGSGSIGSNTNRFTGSFSNSGGTGSGTFQGITFGPQAAELGISFVVNGVTADGGNSNAVGVLVGKRG